MRPERYIVEAAAVTNERLHTREGGDELVWVVVDTKTNDVLGVYMAEYFADQRAHRANHPSSTW